MNIATIFSGIGAPEIAAYSVFANPEIILSCEIDKFARKSYEAIHGHAPHYEDVHDVPAVFYQNRVDLLVGGSPCQSFSLAGLRKGLADERGQLIYQFHRIVDEMRPKVFLFENVKGFRTIDNGETMRQFEESFRRIGYIVKSAVLNTKDYGLPQNRERYFLVGFLSKTVGERFRFPDPIPLDKTLADIIEDEVDEKYYLSEKALRGFLRNNEKHEERGTGFRFIFRPKRDGTANTITVNAGSRATDTFIIQRQRGKNNGNLHAISPAISSSCFDRNNPIYEAGTIRRLTPKECWQLQGFPDWAHDAAKDAGVSDTQRYKQAGNAMSVNVIEAIFWRIAEALNARKERSAA